MSCSARSGPPDVRGDRSQAPIDRHRVVDNGRVWAAGGVFSGLEMGLYLLLEFGDDERFVDTVAKVMEYGRQ